MPVKVFLARVRGGLVVPEPHARLPEGLSVSVIAELPETGLVAVDPEDAELIRALNEAERGRPPATRGTPGSRIQAWPLNGRSDGAAGAARWR